MAIQGRWKLSGGVWTDTSGNGYDLTKTNTVNQANGFLGGTNTAMGMTGTANSYLSRADPANTSGQANISIACRFKPASLSALQVLCSKGALSDSYEFTLFVNTNGTVVFRRSTDGTNFTSVTSAAALSVGTWYTLVAVYDGANLSIFIDNMTTADATAAATGTIYNGTGGFFLGANSNTGNNMNGTLDDVEFFNSAMSLYERNEYKAFGENFAALCIANALSLSTAAANITTGIALQGNGASVSNSQSALVEYMQLLANAYSASVGSASLSTGISFKGDGFSVSSGLGDISVYTHIAGDAFSRSASSGELTTGIALMGDANSVSTALSALTPINQLAADAYSASSASGNLIVGIRFAANATSRSALQGTLIATNTKEILASFYDTTTGAPIVDGVVTLKIRKEKENSFFDFDAKTLKTSGWTTIAMLMAQADVVNARGMYKYIMDLNWLTDGSYTGIIDCAGTPAQHALLEFKVRAGMLTDVYSEYTIAEIDTRAAQSTADQIPQAVRANLATELAMLDVAVSSRPDSAAVAAVVWADANALKLIKTGSNKHVLNPADGTVKIYDDDGTTLLYSGLAYSDAAGTVLYNGTAAVHHTTRLI